MNYNGIITEIPTKVQVDEAVLKPLENVTFKLFEYEVNREKIPTIENDWSENSINMYEWINIQYNFMKHKIDYFNTTLQKKYWSMSDAVDTTLYKDIDKYILEESAEETYVNSVNIASVKFYYPEPYIASPSLIHSDIWYIHISVYNYWLWYFFSFIIVFFFVIFLATMRWNNIRLQPKRETRGFSRSKCGDLITGLVPMMWASSIIVHESIDSADWDDGVGTVEMVMAIRAYQWGWEYWYPRSNDLNADLKNHELLLFGKNGVNAGWCESVVANRYLSEYLNLRNAYSTNKISHIFNINNNNYNLHKLNSNINGKTHVYSKHTNNTRPRHKISLNLDSNTNLYSNFIKPTNYIKYNVTKITDFNRNGVFLIKPLNFYSPLNIFNFQMNCSDAKSYLFLKTFFYTSAEIIMQQTPLTQMFNLLPTNTKTVLHKLFYITSNTRGGLNEFNFNNVSFIPNIYCEILRTQINFFKKINLINGCDGSNTNLSIFFYPKFKNKISNFYAKFFLKSVNNFNITFNKKNKTLISFNYNYKDVYSIFKKIIVNDTFNLTYIKNYNKNNLTNYTYYITDLAQTQSNIFTLNFGNFGVPNKFNVNWYLFKKLITEHILFKKKLLKLKNNEIFNFILNKNNYDNCKLNAFLSQPDRYILKNYDESAMPLWYTLFNKYVKTEYNNNIFLNNKYKYFGKLYNNFKNYTYSKMVFKNIHAHTGINSVNFNFLLMPYNTNINSYYSDVTKVNAYKNKYVLSNNIGLSLSEFYNQFNNDFIKRMSILNLKGNNIKFSYTELKEKLKVNFFKLWFGGVVYSSKINTFANVINLAEMNKNYFLLKGNKLNFSDAFSNTNVYWNLNTYYWNLFELPDPDAMHYFMEFSALKNNKTYILSPDYVLKFRSKFLKNEYPTQLYNAFKYAQFKSLTSEKWILWFNFPRLNNTKNINTHLYMTLNKANFEILNSVIHSFGVQGDDLFRFNVLDSGGFDIMYELKNITFEPTYDIDDIFEFYYFINDTHYNWIVLLKTYISTDLYLYILEYECFTQNLMLDIFEGITTYEILIKTILRVLSEEFYFMWQGNYENFKWFKFYFKVLNLYLRLCIYYIYWIFIFVNNNLFLFVSSGFNFFHAQRDLNMGGEMQGIVPAPISYIICGLNNFGIFILYTLIYKVIVMVAVINFLLQWDLDLWFTKCCTQFALIAKLNGSLFSLIDLIIVFKHTKLMLNDFVNKYFYANTYYARVKFYFIYKYLWVWLHFDILNLNMLSLYDYFYFNIVTLLVRNITIIILLINFFNNFNLYNNYNAMYTEQFLLYTLTNGSEILLIFYNLYFLDSTLLYLYILKFDFIFFFKIIIFEALLTGGNLCTFFIKYNNLKNFSFSNILGLDMFYIFLLIYKSIAYVFYNNLINLLRDDIRYNIIGLIMLTLNKSYEIILNEIIVVILHIDNVILLLFMHCYNIVINLLYTPYLNPMWFYLISQINLLNLSKISLLSPLIIDMGNLKITFYAHTFVFFNLFNLLNHNISFILSTIDTQLLDNSTDSTWLYWYIIFYNSEILYICEILTYLFGMVVTLFHWVLLFILTEFYIWFNVYIGNFVITVLAVNYYVLMTNLAIIYILKYFLLIKIFITQPEINFYIPFYLNIQSTVFNTHNATTYVFIWSNMIYIKLLVAKLLYYKICFIGPTIMIHYLYVYHLNPTSAITINFGLYDFFKSHLLISYCKFLLLIKMDKQSLTIKEKLLLKTNIISTVIFYYMWLIINGCTVLNLYPITHTYLNFCNSIFFTDVVPYYYYKYLFFIIIIYFEAVSPLYPDTWLIEIWIKFLYVLYNPRIILEDTIFFLTSYCPRYLMNITVSEIYIIIKYIFINKFINSIYMHWPYIQSLIMSNVFLIFLYFDLSVDFFTPKNYYFRNDIKNTMLMQGIINACTISLDLNLFKMVNFDGLIRYVILHRIIDYYEYLKKINLNNLINYPKCVYVYPTWENTIDIKHFLKGFNQSYLSFIKAFYTWAEYTDSHLWLRYLGIYATHPLYFHNNVLKVKRLLKKNVVELLKLRTVTSNIKFYSIYNTSYTTNNSAHLFSFPFKDGREFVLLQSRWREIFSNYRKVEVPKPRTATIGQFGGDILKSNVLVNFNDWPSYYKKSLLLDFHTLYQKTFKEKKNNLWSYSVIKPVLISDVIHTTPSYMLNNNTTLNFSNQHFEDIWLGFGQNEFSSFVKLFTKFIPVETPTSKEKRIIDSMYKSLESSLINTTAFAKDLYTMHSVGAIKYPTQDFFNPIFSLSRHPGRNLYQNYKNIATIFTQQATLSEILTIREYLHQKLLYKRKTWMMRAMHVTNMPTNCVYDDLLFLLNYYNVNKVLNDRAYINLYELYDLFNLVQNVFTKYNDKNQYYVFNYIKYKLYLNITPINITPINITPINITPINITPINITPINITPINITPINITPINITPINITPINISKQIKKSIIPDKSVFYALYDELFIYNHIGIYDNFINTSNIISPYKPLRRGFLGLYKLVPQRAIAIPVGVRMHFITTSKDIIHSWAIPSAGIKIDCVPGFCSHRIICFWSTGVFWGQCMEICGRYHHWMPIIVYFLHRDIFILWCMHFMFYKHDLNFLRSYDNTNYNKLYTVKADSNVWLAEYLYN